MNNLAGPTKRSIGIGFMTGIGNMGGELKARTDGSTTVATGTNLMLRYHRILDIY
jgi:hypothetical protein